MRIPGVEILAIAAALTAPPASAAPSPTPATMPWVEIHRREIVCAGREAPAGWKFAARLGAALAWDLADLPGHQTGASQPWGAYQSSPCYRAASGAIAAGGGGAIGALITRWNTLYPPYAVEGTDDLERPGRCETDPSEEPSCPGN